MYMYLRRYTLILKSSMMFAQTILGHVQQATLWTKRAAAGRFSGAEKETQVVRHCIGMSEQ